MTDKGSFKILKAILELKEETPIRTRSTGKAPQGTPEHNSLPTLDERVEMYLRAMHGSKRSFTDEERKVARDRIISAMAVDAAEATKRPSSQPLDSKTKK